MVQPSPIFQMSQQPGFPPSVGRLVQATEVPFGASSQGSPFGSAQPQATASPFGQMNAQSAASPFGAQQFGMQPQVAGQQSGQQQGGADFSSMLGMMTSMVGMLTQIVSFLFMAVMQKLQSQQGAGGLSGLLGGGGQNAVAQAANNGAFGTNGGGNNGGGNNGSGGGTTTRNGNDIITVNPAAKGNGTGGNGKPNVVFEGDSLSVDVGGSYTNQLKERLAKKGVNAHSEATGGDQLRTNIKGDIDAVNGKFDPNAKDNVVVLWAGTNDLYGNAKGADLYEQYKKTAEAYKKKGYKVVVLTSIQFGGSKDNAAQDEQRRIFNDKIRKDGGPWDALVDVASMPEFSDRDNGVTNNRKYYSPDGIHLNGTGYGLVADQVEKALQQLGIG